MYLQSLVLQNTGPIQELRLQMPFDDGRPKPVVLVGPNGSGKSTVLSFIVNALVAFKQRAFENAEVTQGRVYRTRSPRGIRHGATFFRAHLSFTQGLESEEWQLNEARGSFTTNPAGPEAQKVWDAFPPKATSYFAPDCSKHASREDMQHILSSGCLLFFPADRFEHPAWLNSEHSTEELRLPDPECLVNRTNRRILQYTRLKSTLEWAMSLVLDMLLIEYQERQYVLNAKEQLPPQVVTARVLVPGPISAAFYAVRDVLLAILADQPTDKLAVNLEPRMTRVVSAKVHRNGTVIRSVEDLKSMSAGESALFCMFASIIQDADQAGVRFNGTKDIQGIVVIDEADLHLHMSFQYNVLPKLIALFPRVQFIMTVHSPLVLLGMECIMGRGNFMVLEMPSGAPVTPEHYSEFQAAFEVFGHTQSFKSRLLAEVRAQAKPVLLLEGKTDAELISLAWEKLNPSVDMPFSVVGCGAVSGAGGAKALNAALRYLAEVFDKKVLGIFDNDGEGVAQFGGLRPPDFLPGVDPEHKRHSKLDVHAMLLPVPTMRSRFVAAEAKHQVLEIEHYFDDSILQAHKMPGASIFPGAAVFEIKGDKAVFASSAQSFDATAFGNFGQLFARIASILT